MSKLVGILGLYLIAVAHASVAAEVGDPMRPPQAHGTRPAAVAAPVWVLNSTVVSADQRSAVINGRAVTLGDWIQGARVEAIEPAWVRLRGDDGSFVVRLKTYRIKKQVLPQ